MQKRHNWSKHYKRNIGEGQDFHWLLQSMNSAEMKAKRERYIEIIIGPQSGKAKTASKRNIHTFKEFKHSQPHHSLCHCGSLAPETKDQCIHMSKAWKVTEWTSQLVAPFPEKHSFI